MDISLRVWDGESGGQRTHFCLARRCNVQIDFAGALNNVRVFCPLCGAPAVEIDWNPRRDAIDKCAAYAGPRCPHGKPDTSCSEVLESEPDYEYVYLWGVPEFRALRWAEELGIQPGLITEWARPCGICRDRLLRTRYGDLERDLRRLSEHLAKIGAEIQKRVLAISDGIALVHGLIVDIERTKERVELERRGEGLGYVYAISDGNAIKIGWSTNHPTARLVQLQTASPNELRLLGAFLGPCRQEGALHRRFGAHRIRGEWFRHVPEIVEYFTNGS